MTDKLILVDRDDGGYDLAIERENGVLETGYIQVRLSEDHVEAITITIDPEEMRPRLALYQSGHTTEIVIPTDEE